MDKTLRDFAKSVFSDENSAHKPCQDCGGVHPRACPRLASVSVKIDENGVIVEREVTFWAPGTWESYVTFPEDVWADDDAG